jgi:hypothetical protein
MSQRIRCEQPPRRDSPGRPPWAIPAIAATTALFLTAFATSPPATAEPSSAAPDRAAYELTGRVTPRDEGASVGGDLALTGAIRATAPAGGDYRLSAFPASALALAPDGALCFCGDVIFTDDFETGHAGAWSASVP